MKKSKKEKHSGWYVEVGKGEGKWKLRNGFDSRGTHVCAFKVHPILNALDLHVKKHFK